MAAARAEKGAFTTGSTMRHVVVMTTTSSVGLVSVFFVDALNLFYISLLGQQELAAAIGYASTVLFFSVSIAIGITIAASALVAKALGAGDMERARSLTAASLIYLFVALSAFTLLLFPNIEWSLSLLGAEGETLTKATSFMRIVVPSIPLLGLGMCLGALLRSRGDARRGMFVTLFGAIAALFLDPLMIFGFDLGIQGAAIATFMTRVILVIVGLHGVQYVHKMIGRPDFSDLKAHIAPFLKIALPAMATQLATPVGNAYVTSSIAEFGDDAVAGWAIVGRLIPVAFGVIFALSGSVGPIMAQNLGAGLLPRVMQSMKDALKVYGPLAVVILILLIVTMRYIAPPPPMELRFAAGGIDGQYYALAQKYSDALSDHGIDVEILETAGTVENFSLLESGDADVALLQGGIASDLDHTRAQSLGGVLAEPCWIFVARGSSATGQSKGMDSKLMREIMLNGSSVLLVGAFFIGWATGEEGLAEISSFIVSPFKGVLCLFLLDMGLVAGRGLRQGGGILRPGVLAFGVLMPLIGATIGLGTGVLLGLSTGGVVLMMVLSASASYIAVPAAMRVALPEANPSLYLTLSLGVTFPFNLTLGIPLYVAVAQAVTGG